MAEPPPEPQPQPMQPDFELEPEPEPEMLPVIPLVELRARGSILLRPALTDKPGGVVHPMARSNPLGRHSTLPATDATEQEISHPPSQVLWNGPAVALFALPGGGAAALENACPRALNPALAGTCSSARQIEAQIESCAFDLCLVLDDFTQTLGLACGKATWTKSISKTWRLISVMVVVRTPVRSQHLKQAAQCAQAKVQVH
eukprot:COSAG02_NODE_8427_length_2573_cov_11.247373_4_plen_202_part_00